MTMSNQGCVRGWRLRHWLVVWVTVYWWGGVTSDCITNPMDEINDLAKQRGMTSDEVLVAMQLAKPIDYKEMLRAYGIYKACVADDDDDWTSNAGREGAGHCTYCRSEIEEQDKTVKTRQAKCYEKLDLIVVMDDSYTIWTFEFEILRDLVVTIVRQLPNFGPDGSMVGVMTFTYGINVEFPMTRYSDLASTVEAIRAVQKRGGVSRASVAIEEAKTQFDRDGRSNAVKVLLLLTDSDAEDHDRTRTAAWSCRSAGYYIIVIAIGSHYNVTFLAEIADADIKVGWDKLADVAPWVMSKLLSFIR